jgi:hypothetical protein
MAVMKTFVFGAVTGGFVVWMYGDRMRAYIDGYLDTIRGSLLDVVDAVDDTLAAVRERIEKGSAAAGRSGSGELGALAGVERAERRGALGGTGSTIQ